MRAKNPHKKKKKRVGFGPGSGHGKTGTRGQKGQNSRSGVSKRPGWEGGQTPLYRRLPKRGFNNIEFATRYAVINLDRLSEIEEKEINPENLRSYGLIKKNLPLKILGTGEIKKAVVVKAHRFSEAAKEKIEKAGGQAILL
jgi:large subunit ribosomal protein L15